MSNRLLPFAVMLTLLSAGCTHNTMRVANLRCDARENPVGVDDRHPPLGWILQSDRRGDVQTAYQILVASSPSNLAASHGDIWDSGKVPSDQNIDIDYAGVPLVAGHRYWWKVRTWDRDNHPSVWSTPAEWTQGPMSESDWKGQWIGVRTHSPLKSGASNGYHALETKDPSESKWVQVDLGSSLPIDSVLLIPAEPNNYKPRTQGFGFPVRFKIEASDTPDFHTPILIADHSTSDFPNPGAIPQPFTAHNIRARYVRVTGLKNWLRKDGTACFSLAELRVLSDGTNIAESKPTTAKDSVESSGWGLAGLTDGNVPHPTPTDEYAAPLLRKPFSIHQPILRATASISGLGYYELYLNGQKVGDHVLDPGFTAYDKRALYAMYDITDQLRRGDNVLGVILGGGWYELATPDLFGNERAPWTAPPAVRAQLDLDLADGSHQTIVSDNSWKWSTGEITFQCLRAGETHDMRRAKPGWSAAGYDDHDWQAVHVVPGPKGNILAQRQPPIKTAGEISPVQLTHPKPNVYVYKLPENTAGWARFRTTGQPGQKITLRFAETLKPDGTVATFLSSHTYGRWQTGELILSGHGTETFEPRFCYHGFQYVQIEGLTTPPSLSDLTAVRVHTALPVAGTFECSSDLLNRSQAMILRTYLANLHSIPTDCPQREKMGWLCDGMVASNQAMANFDARTLYEKWTADMADAQSDDGSMPAIVPTQGWSQTGHPGADFQCPWWGGATVVVPWNLYQAYRDTRILAQHYDAMRRYVDSLTARASDHLLTFGLGDWLEVDKDGRPVRTPTDLTSTAAYAYFARLLSQTASLLNKPADAAQYATLADQVKDAFNRKYLRPDGRYGDDTQTAPALALVCDLAPPDQRDLIAQRLVENITHRKNHLSTGLVGTLYLFQALQLIGRDDLAYQIATAPDYPGWSHMMNQGATTLWESWDGHGSHNHPALGAPGIWFYTGLAGIRPASPGYKNITIKPAVVGDLTWARAEQLSPFGPIRSSWRLAPNHHLTLDVTIPPNTTAIIYVPTTHPDSVTESNNPAAQSPSVHFLRADDRYAIYEVGSGHYLFSAAHD